MSNKNAGHCGFCIDCSKDAILYKNSVSFIGHLGHFVMTALSTGAWLLIWVLSCWWKSRSWKCMVCDGSNVELTGGFDFILRELEGCVLHGEQKSMLDGKSFANSLPDVWSEVSIGLQDIECHACGGHKLESKKFYVFYAPVDIEEEVSHKRGKGNSTMYSNQLVESGWVVFPMLDGINAYLTCLDCGSKMEPEDGMNVAAGVAVAAMSAWAVYSLTSS